MRSPLFTAVGVAAGSMVLMGGATAVVSITAITIFKGISSRQRVRSFGFFKMRTLENLNPKSFVRHCWYI